MGRKPTEVVQVKLRLREDLRRKLLREAEKKDHSLNVEIVWRLLMSFEDEELMGKALAKWGKQLDEIGATVKQLGKDLGRKTDET